MSKEATADPIHYSDWSALLGFMPEQEALNYVHGGVPDPITTDQEWLAIIRKTREHTASIPARVDLKPEIEDLASQFPTRLASLQAEPTFQEHLIGMKGIKFANIEIAKLRCFQTNLNLEYIDALIKTSPAEDDRDGTAKFCLPLREERRKVEVLSSFNPTTNSTSLVSQNLDMRVLGTVQGEDQASGRKFAGFVYGFGLPQVSVVEYNGAYFVKNGYHRAFALFKKGHSKLPCLLVSTDLYESTSAQRPGFFPFDLMTSNKPPLLIDFDSPAAARVPRRRTRAVINMHAEVQLIPV
jgi:hypothetical protein